MINLAGLKILFGGQEGIHEYNDLDSFNLKTLR